MKIVSGVVLILLLWAAHGLAAPPHSVAGFRLGADISEVQDRLRMETALPIRYMESVKEVEIQPVPGFKTGLVAYGTCANPGRIIRIKGKYENESREFFEELLARYKQRFGQPTEWQGDPFHVILDWKWSFVDAEGNRISLHLSHNLLDREEKFGNSVKLTLTEGLEAEEACFHSKYPDFRPPGSLKGKGTPKKPDWETLLPK